MAERARPLDPLWVTLRSDICLLEYFAGRSEVAIRSALLVLEMDPSAFYANRCLLLAHLARGETGQAREAARREMELVGAGAAERATVSHVPPEQGMTRFWRWRAANLQERIERGDPVPAFGLALARLELGDRSETLHWLEKAVDGHEWQVLFLAAEPELRPLHCEPSFRRLVARVGLRFPRDVSRPEEGAESVER
jgi:hypothetical protein